MNLETCLSTAKYLKLEWLCLKKPTSNCRALLFSVLHTDYSNPQHAICPHPGQGKPRSLALLLAGHKAAGPPRLLKHTPPAPACPQGVSPSVDICNNLSPFPSDWRDVYLYANPMASPPPNWTSGRCCKGLPWGLYSPLVSPGLCPLQFSWGRQQAVGGGAKLY